MNLLKNKPFHLMLALIFICTTTKTIHADSIKTPSQENSEFGILGNKDSLYLEKREEVWHLMSCEGSSLCREVGMNDVNVDKIASHLKDLRPHLDDYCTQDKEDYLCELFALSLDLAQRKRERNIDVAWAVAWALALVVVVVWAVAWALAWALALVVAGTLVVTVALVVAGTWAKYFRIAQEDIEKIRMELSKILEENAQNDSGFTGMP